MNKAFVFLLTLLFATLAAAQNGDRPSLLQIRDKVLDSGGIPVERALVSALPDSLSGRPPTALSDKDGKFAIEAYKGGRWTLNVTRDGYPTTFNAFLYPDAKWRPEVILTEKNEVSFVNLPMPDRPGILKVRITDKANRKAVGETRVKLCRLESPGYCYTIVRTPVNGAVEIYAPAASFTVSISNDRYDDWTEKIIGGVRTGEVRELAVSMTDELSRDGNRLAAPPPVSPADGTVLSGFPRLTRLQWDPVPGAVTYIVDLEYCDFEDPFRPVGGKCYPLDHFRNPPTSGITDTGYEFNFLGAQPGRWRVWAVDADGRLGKKSNWYKFFYQQ